MVRLLSWNVWHGRASEAALVLANQLKADAVLLQEAKPPLTWAGSSVGKPVQHGLWGSYLMVRDGTLKHIEVADYDGWVAGALWRRGDDELYVFSLHSPTSSEARPRQHYVLESRRIVDVICRLVPRGSPLVIGGDFNFKSFGERHPSEELKSEKFELDAIRSFRDHGLAVAWQDCHPGQPLGQTLRWSGNRMKPYHCDGFLIRGLGALALGCQILTPDGDRAVSDHNAMLLDLGAEPDHPAL